MYLSELICQARQIIPLLGDLEGKCCFCGRETAHGHKRQFGDSFCNAPYLGDGDVICEYCQHMNAGKQYRNSMWIVSQDGFRFFKRDEARGILLDPPDAPFALCLTRTWKKSSWQALLRLNGGIAESRDIFPVGFDYDPCYIDRQKLKADLSIIDGLYKPNGKLLLSKGELESGKISTSGMSKLMASGMDAISTMEYLKTRSNDPVWSLEVFVA